MRRVSLVLIVVGCMLVAAAASGQQPLARPDAMKLLAEPGRWINTDGALQPDGTYVAKQIMIYAPTDSVNIGERAIIGTISNLNRVKNTLTVLNYRVTFDAKTTLKDEAKQVIPVAKIQDGMGAKVQGQLLPDGTFHATKARWVVVLRRVVDAVGSRVRVVRPICQSVMNRPSLNHSSV